MIDRPIHISVCICTYRRPAQLQRLLAELSRQDTKGLFVFSIVIADNDHRQSAKQVVSEFAATSSISIIYCIEPEQNIALARNKALENAKGDFIAFIDDDEIPEEDWLFNLLEACNFYGVDGVLGPVRPRFEHKPLRWIVKGKIFERQEHENGYKMDWSETRTGNLLFRREIISGIDYAFRPEFGTGSEDVDFFRRMIGTGKIFAWCNNAVVYETVPPERCNRSYLLKLALLRGGNSLKHRERRGRNLIKSFIAVPLYCLAIPFLFFAGHHYVMIYLIKLCDHIGRLLALVGINPVKKRDF
jgi:succinoglycan biosynthesis protein ExoM